MVYEFASNPENLPKMGCMTWGFHKELDGDGSLNLDGQDKVKFGR